MSKLSDFLLGRSIGLLSQVRAYAIKQEDMYLVGLIENEYEEILNGLNNLNESQG